MGSAPHADEVPLSGHGLSFSMNDPERQLRSKGNGVRVSGFGLRISGFGFRDSGIGFRGSGFGIRDSGFGVRVRGSRFYGLWFMVRGSWVGIEG